MTSMVRVRVRSVAAAPFSTLVLTEAGEVFSCGDGISGNLGHGDGEPQWQPKLIEALCGVRASAVSAGMDHSLVLTEAGDALSFGDATVGQLGYGDEENQLLSSAGDVYSFGVGGWLAWARRPGEGAAAEARGCTRLHGSRGCVCAGYEYSLALSSAGQVYSFGNGATGSSVTPLMSSFFPGLSTRCAACVTRAPQSTSRMLVLSGTLATYHLPCRPLVLVFSDHR